MFILPSTNYQQSILNNIWFSLLREFMTTLGCMKSYIKQEQWQNIVVFPIGFWAYLEFIFFLAYLFFFFLEWKHVFYAYLSIVVWIKMTCLISLGSGSIMTWVLFLYYLHKTLEFGFGRSWEFGGTGIEWMYLHMRKIIILDMAGGILWIHPSKVDSREIYQ